MKVKSPGTGIVFLSTKLPARRSNPLFQTWPLQADGATALKYRPFHSTPLRGIRILSVHLL